jgi:hypothetical protein
MEDRTTIAPRLPPPASDPRGGSSHLQKEVGSLPRKQWWDARPDGSRDRPSSSSRGWGGAAAPAPSSCPGRRLPAAHLCARRLQCQLRPSSTRVGDFTAPRCGRRLSAHPSPWPNLHRWEKPSRGAGEGQACRRGFGCAANLGNLR